MEAPFRNIRMKLLQRIRKIGVLPILEECIPKHLLSINVSHRVCNLEHWVLKVMDYRIKLKSKALKSIKDFHVYCTNQQMPIGARHISGVCHCRIAMKVKDFNVSSYDSNGSVFWLKYSTIKNLTAFACHFAANQVKQLLLIFPLLHFSKK